MRFEVLIQKQSRLVRWAHTILMSLLSLYFKDLKSKMGVPLAEPLKINFHIEQSGFQCEQDDRARWSPNGSQN